MGPKAVRGNRLWQGYDGGRGLTTSARCSFFMKYPRPFCPIPDAGFSEAAARFCSTSDSQLVPSETSNLKFKLRIFALIMVSQQTPRCVSQSLAAVLPLNGSRWAPGERNPASHGGNIGFDKCGLGSVSLISNHLRAANFSSRGRWNAENGEWTEFRMISYFGVTTLDQQESESLEIGRIAFLRDQQVVPGGGPFIGQLTGKCMATTMNKIVGPRSGACTKQP